MTTRYLRRALTPLAFAVCTSASCAYQRPLVMRAEPVGAALVVRNNNFLPARVAVVRAGVSHRLGTFVSLQGETAALPADLIGWGRALVFVLTLVGSDAIVTSDPIYVYPGQIVEWTIGDPLEYSRVMVR